MAITVISPTRRQEYLPSNNVLDYKFHTDLLSNDYNFRVNVFINDILSAKLAFYKKSINFNVSKIINNYLSVNYENDTVIPLNIQDKTLKLYLEISGYILDTPSGETAVQTDPIYIWKSAAGWTDSKDLTHFADKFQENSGTIEGDVHTFPKVLGAQSEINYDMTGSFVFNNKILLKKIFENNSYLISPTERRTISYFRYTNAANPSISVYGTDELLYNVLTVTVFDKDFNFTKYGSVNIETSYYGVNLRDIYTSKLRTIPVGINELNDYITTNGVWTLRTGTISNIDINEDKYYVITISNSDHIFALKAISFEICSMPKFDVYNVIYFSKEGGWWQIRCDALSGKQNKSTINYRKKILYSPIENKTREYTPVSILSNEHFVLNTKILNKQYMINEIKDMIDSPYIYIQNVSTGEIFPAQLEKTDFDVSNFSQCKLTNYTFEFKLSYNNRTLI